MVARRRRTVPTYLVRRRGQWCGRFRHVDSLSIEHWPRKVSPSPLDYQRSLAWVAAWRLDWIRDHEVALRAAEDERQRPPTLGELWAPTRPIAGSAGPGGWARRPAARSGSGRRSGGKPPTRTSPRLGSPPGETACRESRRLSARTLNA